MSDGTIRPAFPRWPTYNQRLRDVVAALTEAQSAVQPAPDRWPLWATIGHLACQRVSWLCGVAGEPGAAQTPFPNALYECPGDEDLEHVLGPQDLAEALDATFAIVERCLDTWTPAMLAETIQNTFGDETHSHARGEILSRVFAHDVYHIAELNEALGRMGVAQVELWD